jgi:hypothetical protein
VIKRVLFSSLAVVGLLGLALVVGAQGPGPRGGFGRRGHGGPGGGGWWGSAACAQKQNCPQYVFKYTRTSVQPVLLATGPDKVTNTTTGMIAGDNYGSTYRDVTLSAWGAQSGPQEFIYVRDLDPKVMMNYIQNVTKGTYEQFPIKPRTPPGNGNPNPNWKGGGPDGKGSGRSGEAPTSTTGPYSLPDGSYTCPDAETTTITHGANSTTNRVYCPDLHLVLKEDHTDPRFGSSTYLLSNYNCVGLKSCTGLANFLPFTPTGKLVERGKFGHGGGPRGDDQRRLPPSP